MTAAATDEADVVASFSNYGTCVYIWAPGVAVNAPWLMAEGASPAGTAQNVTANTAAAI